MFFYLVVASAQDEMFLARAQGGEALCPAVSGTLGSCESASTGLNDSSPCTDLFLELGFSRFMAVAGACSLSPKMAQLNGHMPVLHKVEMVLAGVIADIWASLTNFGTSYMVTFLTGFERNQLSIKALYAFSKDPNTVTSRGCNLWLKCGGIVSITIIVFSQRHVAFVIIRYQQNFAVL